MTAVDAVNAPVVRVRRLDRVGDAEVRALAEVLVDVVAGDGSVSFMHPLDPARAETFWRSVADGVARGERALLVAEEQVGDPDGPDGGWQVVGSVHLVLALPENQPHRADVTKLVVHRRARRRGVATRLMTALEDVARDCGRSVLVLDTETGAPAEALYAGLGWRRVGVVPDFALRPHGGLAATTFFYKRLDAAE